MTRILLAYYVTAFQTFWRIPAAVEDAAGEDAASPRTSEVGSAAEDATAGDPYYHFVPPRPTLRQHRMCAPIATPCWLPMDSPEHHSTVCAVVQCRQGMRQRIAAQLAGDEVWLDTVGARTCSPSQSSRALLLAGGVEPHGSLRCSLACTSWRAGLGIARPDSCRSRRACLVQRSLTHPGTDAARVSPLSLSWCMICRQALSC
jgi:hypothetical protein